ncbi:aldose 1-epimerase [Baekduia alba]|uniref:aldose 1-epimerase n=1 Tax=Baekduia alba TaxID=2997333 RepID=UPI0023405D83|nr:aldose 1-epimerase [Baekduia alba]
MVGVSLFGSGRELLGQMGGLDAYAARGATFGIPLLHPWANRLGGFAYEAAGHAVALGAETPGLRIEEHGLPIHGLLSASKRWEVREVTDRTLVASLDFGADPALLAAFPYPHVLELRVEQSSSALTVTTTLTPTSDQPVPVSFGFHPYFTLPGVDRGHLILRTPAMSKLLLDDHDIPTGETVLVAPRHAPIGDEDLDTGYTDLGAEPAFTMAGGGHELTMRFLEGYTHLQLFTPPNRSVLAIEPMTAPTDALRSGTGLRTVTEPFRATFAVDLSEAS